MLYRSTLIPVLSFVLTLLDMEYICRHHLSFREAFNQIVFFQQGPVVLVPTTYYKTPVDEWRQRQVSLIIWANHSIRASVKAMQDLTRHIYEHQSTAGVEDKVILELVSDERKKQEWESVRKIR